MAKQRCVLCGSETALRFVMNYAGVSGANAWLCNSSLECARRQVEQGHIPFATGSGSVSVPRSGRGR